MGYVPCLYPLKARIWPNIDVRGGFPENPSSDTHFPTDTCGQAVLSVFSFYYLSSFLHSFFSSCFAGSKLLYFIFFMMIL